MYTFQCWCILCIAFQAIELIQETECSNQVIWGGAESCNYILFVILPFPLSNEEPTLVIAMLIMLGERKKKTIPYAKGILCTKMCSVCNREVFTIERCTRVVVRALLLTSNLY